MPPRWTRANPFFNLCAKETSAWCDGAMRKTEGPRLRGFGLVRLTIYPKGRAASGGAGQPWNASFLPFSPGRSALAEIRGGPVSDTGVFHILVHPVHPCRVGVFLSGAYHVGMSNRAALVKPSDITRLLTGIRAAGFAPGSVVVDNTGRIEIIIRGDEQDGGRGANPCDRLLKGRAT